MKKAYFKIPLFICCLLAAPSFLFSQQKECVTVEWSRNYGGFLNDSANDVIQTNDGGFVAVGFSRSSNFDVSQNYGKSDYWVLKVDSIGDVEWEKNFGGSENDIASSVVQAPDGGYLVAGGSVSFDLEVIGNNGNEDVWVLKLTPDGVVEWTKTYGGSSNERAESIEMTTDGGYILAGYSDSQDGDVGSNHGDFDYWLVKIDPDGNLLWENNFGGSFSDWGFDVKQTPDGGYLMAGSTFSDNGDVSSNNGFYDYWLVKTDANGNMEWEQNYGGTLEERAYSIVLTQNGEAIIAGTSNSGDWDLPGNNGSYDYWLIKIATNGDLIWSNNFGGSAEDRAFALAETSDGDYLVTGFSVSVNGDVGGNYGSKDAWLIKFDTDGKVIWENNFGGTKEDRLFAIIERNGQGFLGAGLSASDNNHLPANQGGQDLWLVSLSPDSLSIDLGNDTTLCSNDGLLLNIDLDDITYLWQDGSTAPAFAVGTEGAYWLEIDKDGCKARDTIQVDYLSHETVDLGTDTILCEGETLLIAPQIEDAQYFWRDGTIEETFLVTIPGTYWVTVTKDGCEQKDTLEVDFTEIEIGFDENAFICQGDDSVLDAEHPQATYLWQDNSTEPSFLVNGPGIFSVTVTVGGCNNSDTISIDFQPGPDSIFMQYEFICENQGIWFDASFPDATYLWQDGSVEPRYKAVLEGNYSVQVSINGCVFEEEAELISCERCLYTPNIFSPNGDGFNDVFRSFPICDLLNYQQQIFDRWGNLVFESYATDESWDGTHKGQKADLGTYTYLIRYDLMNNGRPMPQQRIGAVDIIR